MVYTPQGFKSVSPSLRGSGLKSCGQTTYMILRPVSLFTREWIEIQNFNLTKSKNRAVSLFTREWIEILLTEEEFSCIMSPSLRGSGLK